MDGTLRVLLEDWCAKHDYIKHLEQQLARAQGDNKQVAEAQRERHELVKRVAREWWKRRTERGGTGPIDKSSGLADALDALAEAVNDDFLMMRDR